MAFLLIAVGTDPSNDLSEWLGQELSKSDRPELTAANAVVSGGTHATSHALFYLTFTTCICFVVAVVMFATLLI